MDSSLAALLTDTVTIRYPTTTVSAYGPPSPTAIENYPCRVTKRLDVVEGTDGAKLSSNYLIRIDASAALLTILQSHSASILVSASGFTDEKLKSWSASYDDTGALWSIRIWC